MTATVAAHRGRCVLVDDTTSELFDAATGEPYDWPEVLHPPPELRVIDGGRQPKSA
jgi:hypothetical protein